MRSADDKQARFAEAHRSSTKPLVFDLESDGLLDELTQIHCLCVGSSDAVSAFNGQSNGQPSIEMALELLADAEEIIGQNILGFDIPAIQMLYPEWKPKGKVTDTLVLSRLAYPHMDQVDYHRQIPGMPKKLYGRHSLESWGWRLGIYKGDYGQQENAWAEWSQSMEDYCLQDVTVTQALYDHLMQIELSPAAIDTETQLQDIICHQERRGFKFDIPAAQQLAAKLQDRQRSLLSELQETFPPIEPECLGVYGNQKKRMERLLVEQGSDPSDWATHREWLEARGIKFKWSERVEFNPNSGDQVAERLTQLGWVPTDHTPTGKPKTDEPILIDCARQFEKAKPLVEHSLVEKRLGQIANGPTAWLKKVGDDGRMHGRCNTMGTITYRFTHSSPNMGQVPSVRAPYGRECRGFFGVDPGWKLVGHDVSGLELRVMAHYMARWDGGEYARIILEGDIHTRNQESADLSTRDQAKTMIYALIYGAGDAKLGQISVPDEGDIKKLQKIGKGLRSRFMKATPALQRLSTAVRQKAAKSKTLRGLDGRDIRIRSAHSALNALFQSAGSIIVKVATVRFRQLLEEEGHDMGKDWSLVAHVHDEWQTECREGIAEYVAQTAIKATEQAGEICKLRIPTTGESKIGNNWAETH